MYSCLLCIAFGAVYVLYVFKAIARTVMTVSNVPVFPTTIAKPNATTQRVNQAYAYQFGHDYGVLRSSILLADASKVSWGIVHAENHTFSTHGTEC